MDGIECSLTNPGILEAYSDFPQHVVHGTGTSWLLLQSTVVSTVCVFVIGT